jgi:hypothetical protein
MGRNGKPPAKSGAKGQPGRGRRGDFKGRGHTRSKRDGHARMKAPDTGVKNTFEIYSNEALCPILPGWSSSAERAA